MTSFKALLVVMAVGLLIYTLMAVGNEGVNLFASTLPAVPQFGWQGQFHLDFVTYLMLSGLWIAWRHEFSGAGIALAIGASLIGIMFFAVYLLIAINKADGDMRQVLLGDRA